VARVRTALLALLALLALAAVALADSKMTVSGDVLFFRSEDAGVANRLTIDRDARGRVHLVDEADPAGINYPSPPCSPGRVNNAGNAVEVFCEQKGFSKLDVETGPGEDHVTSTLTDLSVLLVGAVGADTLVTGAGADVLNGGQGDDTLRSGDGNDRLDGNEGADTLDAGGGDDTVLAGDGVIDTIDCGAGTDRATVDTCDKVVNCETVNAGGTATAPTTADHTRPKVQIGGSTAQRITSTRRRVAVAVTVDEPARVDLSGYLEAGDENSPLKPVTGRVKVGGAGTTLRLTLPKSAVRRVLGDFRHHRKPLVHVTVSAVDPAGNTSRPRKLRIFLRR
jgi:hypothetical protein